MYNVYKIYLYAYFKGKVNYDNGQLFYVKLCTPFKKYINLLQIYLKKKMKTCTYIY